VKSSIIRSSWLPKGGFRLDCSPYLGGALETEILLENLSVRKDALGQVTKAIFNGPKFSRTYVEDPQYGVPFLGGSSLQNADLSDLPLLSKQQALGKHLRHLEVKRGMTLITCSGTIGKMAYARSEMEGMWASQHVMKVVHDEGKIPSGYLYAFLSSKFGIPMIMAGTYGSIIQSIEPHHIAGLPIPRFGDDLEGEIHGLMEKAAELRSHASRLKKASISTFEKRCQIPHAKSVREYPSPLYGRATSGMLADRMDSTYFIPPCTEAREAFDQAAEQKRLGEVASVFIPGIFKREYSSDANFGYPYLTGADVFCIKPKSEQNLLKTVAERYSLVLEEGMIVLHEAGQRYGLIGHGVMVGATLDGFACTNNMVRISPFHKEDAGYIYAVLSSEHGVRLLKREAAGSSIPHLDESRIRNLSIPWPSSTIRKEVANLAHQARSNWDEADKLEDKALNLLAEAIKTNSPTA
jgi:type I restriction enzyme S subunit